VRLSSVVRAGVRVAALASLVGLAAAPPLSAQTPAAAPVIVTVAPLTLAPGGKAEAKVTVEILRGIRIVAPGSEGAYIQPAVLAFEAAGGLYAETPAWPAGKEWHADEGDPPIRIYEGKVELKMVVHARPEAAAQTQTLQGRLRYQAVHGDRFEKTAILMVKLPVTVTAPAAAPKAKAKPPAATRP